MDCRDVKNKLPHYLSEQCSPEEKLEISKHLSTCPDCMEALDKLEEPILNNINCSDSLDTGKLLSKARKSLILKVATTSMLSVIMLISIFFVIIPGIFKAIRYPKIPDITRSLIDITQFAFPSQVAGYGNSLASFGKYSFNISVYTNDITGTKMKNEGEVERNFNMITGTYESPVHPIGQFINPQVIIPDEYLKQYTSDIAKKILIKNGEATTAVVDISLNSAQSLEEIAAALKDLDVKPLWMAVECGFEGKQPMKVLGSGSPPIQWGIPANLYIPNNPNPAEFSYSNVSQYERSVIEELKWLNKNKKYIAANKDLLKYQGLDNSVGNRAKYIIDNGIKVYGLRITGPSAELSKLGDKLDIRTEYVIDVDFYYWK